MSCITPLTVKNPQMIGSGQYHYIKVPCGKCSPCLRRRSAQWTFRLQKEELVSKTSSFLTLTYDEQNVPISDQLHRTLYPEHVTNFMKRLRKKCPDKLKYYFIGEYGGQTERPHYHAIMFNLPEKFINNEHYLEDTWTHGHVQADECTPASINYVTGYLSKQKWFSNLGENDDRTPEFSRMSKGLGKSYLTHAMEKRLKTVLNPYLVIEDGKKIPIPRYFKDKVFTPSERLILAEKAKNHTKNIEDDATHHLETVKFEIHQRNLDSKKRRKL